MKASELVARLQMLIVEHGDLIVVDDDVDEILSAYLSRGWDIGGVLQDVFFVSPGKEE